VEPVAHIRAWLHRGALPAVVGGAALVVHLGGTRAAGALRYERHAVAGGQWWRLFTGQLVHLNGAHLLLNLAGLALVWLLVGRWLRGWRGLVALATSGASVGLGLFLFAPQVAWYVGLSGPLHGLLVAGVVGWLLEEPTWEAELLLLLLAAKLAWEQGVAPVALTAALVHGPVVVDAHLYGAAGGLVALALYRAHPT